MQIQRSSGTDFLKIFLVTLVVLSHAGLPYYLGPYGYWYFQSSTFDSKFFTPWNYSFSAFIINTFFFVSGIYSFYSIRKHDSIGFLQTRLKKLLIPLILGFLFILPPLTYYHYLNYQPVIHVDFFSYLFSFWFGVSPEPSNWIGNYPDMNLGHLWFLEHLLLYSFLLIVLFELFKKKSIPKFRFSIYFTCLLLATISFTYIIKFFNPPSGMNDFLGFIQVDYYHVMQNFLLFFAGVFFAKSDYEKYLSIQFKKVLFYIGTMLALLPFIIFYIFPLEDYLYTNNVFFCIWESTTAVIFSIGSVVYINILFKNKNTLLVYLGNLSYIMYVIHVVFVVILQIAIENIFTNPLVKFIVVAISSIILTIFSSVVLSFLYTYISGLNKRKLKNFFRA